MSSTKGTLRVSAHASIPRRTIYQVTTVCVPASKTVTPGTWSPNPGNLKPFRFPDFTLRRVQRAHKPSEDITGLGWQQWIKHHSTLVYTDFSSIWMLVILPEFTEENASLSSNIPTLNIIISQIHIGWGMCLYQLLLNNHTFSMLFF